MVRRSGAIRDYGAPRTRSVVTPRLAAVVGFRGDEGTRSLEDLR